VTGGEAGAEARHRYVLQQHMLAHRIRDILGHVTGETAICERG